jgi:hypothetical protein
LTGRRLRDHPTLQAVKHLGSQLLRAPRSAGISQVSIST